MKSSLNKNGEPSSVIGTKFSCNALKSKTKNELIGYLNIAQYNYERVNESLFNLRQYAEKLDKALDEACKFIEYYSRGCPYAMFDYDRKCQESCINNPKKCWKEYFLKGDKE